jgi:hypothetical protein
VHLARIKHKARARKHVVTVDLRCRARHLLSGKHWQRCAANIIR